MKKRIVEFFLAAVAVLIILHLFFPRPEEILIGYFIEGIIEPICCWIPALFLSVIPATAVSYRKHKSRRSQGRLDCEFPC